MNNIRSKVVCSLGVLAVLCAATLSGAEPPTPNEPPRAIATPAAAETPTPQATIETKTSAKKDKVKGGPRPINITSQKLDYDEKKKKVRLIGTVKIVSDHMTLTSPYAEFFTDKKTAEFQGGVKMVGEGTTATGRQMHVFYNDQRVVLTGDVRMVSEKGAGAQPGTPSVLLCQEMEYFWITGIGKAKGRVKIRQGNRRAFSDRAIYHRLQQTVDMFGNVQFEQGQDDWMSCEKATMDLAAQTIVGEGGVMVRAKMDDKSTTNNTAVEKPSQAQSVPIEPELPYKTVEVPPVIKLPGVDQ